MRCSKCGAENPEGLKFCDQCAAPFKQRCAKCGFENSPAARFCGECAAPLKSSPGAALPLRPIASAELPESIRQSTADYASVVLDGERKTVTMLFADIKGSMDLMEDLDPEEARAILDPALKLMMDAVQRYGGYVAQPTGDGIFALFGAPVAQEDHPQRALLAGLRMQEELKRYSDRIRAEGRLPVQARVGVNTGEVVVRSIPTGEGRTEYAPVGHSTGIAARMQALAPVGSIAATEQVRKLCEGYFLFKSLGPTNVKGVSEPQIPVPLIFISCSALIEGALAACTINGWSSGPSRFGLSFFPGVLRPIYRRFDECT
jgi:class 3 adenylate cyclase